MTSYGFSSDGLRVGVIAPSYQIPRVEFELGLESLRDLGLQVEVHPQCYKKHLFFAGTDLERAEAFFEFAKNPSNDVLWCARGGYGAIRLLPILDQLSDVQGIPEKKLFIGYSDSTALMNYVREKWGWDLLHAMLPSERRFGLLSEEEKQSLIQSIRNYPMLGSWAKKPLHFWTAPPNQWLRGPLVGGNLSVWASMVGTSYAGSANGCFLFLEDVGESHYRIDRMLQQILLSGGLSGVLAIVLGDFFQCEDRVPLILKKKPLFSENTSERTEYLMNPPCEDLVPLRLAMSPEGGLREVITGIAQQCKIPVAYGLPVGHGPGRDSLPLGISYVLSPEGILNLDGLSS